MIDLHWAWPFSVFLRFGLREMLEIFCSIEMRHHLVVLVTTKTTKTTDTGQNKKKDSHEHLTLTAEPINCWARSPRIATSRGERKCALPFLIRCLTTSEETMTARLLLWGPPSERRYRFTIKSITCRCGSDLRNRVWRKPSILLLTDECTKWADKSLTHSSHASTPCSYPILQDSHDLTCYPEWRQPINQNR